MATLLRAATARVTRATSSTSGRTAPSCGPTSRSRIIERDATGQAVSIMAIVQDLSERKSLEQNLHRTRDLLDLAVRSSHLSIFELDLPDGRLETCRPTLDQFLGACSATIPPRRRTEFGAVAARVLTPEDMERVPSEINAYLSGAIPRFELEHQLRKKDGSLEWRLARGVAVRDERGTPTRLIGSHVDITDRKELERELRHTKERLELAIRSSSLSIWEYDMPDGVIDVARQTLINVCEALGYDDRNAWAAIENHPPGGYGACLRADARLSIRREQGVRSRAQGPAEGRRLPVGSRSRRGGARRGRAKRFASSARASTSPT